MNNGAKIKNPKLSFGLKPLYFIILALALAILMIFFSIYGLRQNRDNMLAVMRNNGFTLLESLIFNSKTIIEGGGILEDAVRDHYIRSIQNLKNAGRAQLRDGGDLRAQVFDANADGGLVLRGRSVVEIYPEKDSPLGKYITQNIDNLFEATSDLNPDEFRTFILEGLEDEILTVVGGVDEDDESFYLFKIGDFSFPGLQELTIGNLIDEISKEPEVEYLLLQNYDGIIFASRKIQRMLSIEDDPFLDEALTDSLKLDRITEFNNREVLEVVAPFYSEEDFRGLFRLGLSLDLYNQLADDHRKRTILLTGLLVLLVFLMTGAIFITQRYSLVSAGYRHIQNTYQQILSRMPSGVLEVNSNGIIEALNPAGGEIIRIDPDRAVGSKIDKVLPAEIVRSLRKPSSISSIEEIEIETSESDVKTLSIISSEVIHPETGEKSKLSIFYDITVLKNLQEQQKRNERLRELGNMSAGVAHEIRNPLNAISIAVQRLKSEFTFGSDTEAQSLLEHLSSETRRLNKIVEDFLLFARYSHSPGSSELKATVEEVSMLLSGVAEQSSVKIETAISDNPRVALCKDDFKKVLINLINNSIDSCKDGGDIFIQSHSLDNDKVELQVTDTGPGIPEDLKNKIFQPYVSGKKSGTGLGLAIVARIIEDAGGTIYADNRKEGGAVFTIQLPREGE
ncbi:MAG: hypothetical protein GF307_08115 [candidate division Zixibacteria bacterium]|nr:hypothetical protein [candidate division Zixibacteria bacterium]